MEEPQRIGLTRTTNDQVTKLLDELNHSEKEESTSLNKFDLARLAVALEIKRGTAPPPLDDITQKIWRVSELDRDGAVLYSVLESLNVVPKDIPIYSYIERLAESGIKQFCEIYEQTGELPWEEYFS